MRVPGIRFMMDLDGKVHKELLPLISRINFVPVKADTFASRSDPALNLNNP